MATAQSFSGIRLSAGQDLSAPSEATPEHDTAAHLEAIARRVKNAAHSMRVYIGNTASGRPAWTQGRAARLHLWNVYGDLLALNPKAIPAEAPKRDADACLRDLLGAHGRLLVAIQGVKLGGTSEKQMEGAIDYLVGMEESIRLLSVQPLAVVEGGAA